MKTFKLRLIQKIDDHRNFYNQLMDELDSKGLQPDIDGDLLSDTELTVNENIDLQEVIKIINDLGGRTTDSYRFSLVDLFSGMVFHIEEV